MDGSAVIAKLEAQPEPRHFYDGGTDAPDDLPDPTKEPRIVLERLDSEDLDKVERFLMLRRLAYDDDVHGLFLVPDVLVDQGDRKAFRTDLASVPALFTWLVPKTGRHLPPALVHDALVHDELPMPLYRGKRVTRPEADEVFRRAMRDSGTGPVRAWLVWSAVTLGTIKDGSASWSSGRHWRYRLAAVLSLLVVAALGVIATLDLVDVVAWLPWMGADRSFVVEVAGGLAGAVVIPILLSLTWGRFRLAGAITGIALAVLLHVTVALAAITLLYQGTEWLARRRPVATAVLVAVVVAASLVLTFLLVGTAEM